MELVDGQTRPFESIKLKLLTDTGNAASPIVSPDGRYVVYTSRDRAKLWLNQPADLADRLVSRRPNTRTLARRDDE